MPTPFSRSSRTLHFRLAGALALVIGVTGLAACSSGGGAGTPLAPGLTASMDQAGAQLDTGAALSIVNSYRATRGAQPLSLDPALTQQAQTLATQYAGSGTPPPAPADVAAARYSAGYLTFAETFSGWRNSSQDAQALTAPGARAGLAVSYDPNSAYGAHWVLLIDQG